MPPDMTRLAACLHNGTDQPTLSEIEHLRAAFLDLPHLHQEVLRLRFGLDGQTPATLHSIADSYADLTGERVRLIEADALARLARAARD